MISTIAEAKKLKAGRLVSVSCVMEGDGHAVFYHFSSNTRPEMLELRIDVPKGETAESLIPLFANAELFESEATELYGVEFVGNPSSGKRLFLEEK